MALYCPGHWPGSRGGNIRLSVQSDGTILSGQKSLQLPPYWLAAYLLTPLAAPQVEECGHPTLPSLLPLSPPREWCLDGALSHRPWAHY